jgi:hypothetical protein
MESLHAAEACVLTPRLKHSSWVSYLVIAGTKTCTTVPGLSPFCLSAFQREDLWCLYLPESCLSQKEVLVSPPPMAAVHSDDFNLI